MCKELQLYFQLKRERGRSTPLSALPMLPTKSFFGLVNGQHHEEEKCDLPVTRATPSTLSGDFSALGTLNLLLLVQRTASRTVPTSDTVRLLFMTISLSPLSSPLPISWCICDVSPCPHQNSWMSYLLVCHRSPCNLETWSNSKY